MKISRETGEKWAHIKNCKKKERKLSCGWEFREKRDWFSTSDFPLEPPFVTVADAKFKSSLNFIQCPSSSSRKNNFNFNFHLNTVADAKFKSSLKFIQCPSSSSRRNNFNLDFRLNTVSDAKSLKAL